MPFQSLQPAGECRKKLIVVIILLIWVIMTMKTGSAWLTPMEIAFCALLLGQPSRGDRPIN